MNLKENDGKQMNASLPNAFFKTGVIGAFFLLVSLINVWAFARYNWLFGGQDLQFHLQRIDELFYNVEHFNLLPMLGTFDFNQTGSAVMAMYPKLPLYPYVLIRLVVRQPILSYYLGNALMTFFCLLMSYYSFLSVKKTARVSALIFSMVYSLSALNVSYQYIMADLGIVATIVFLPLAFAGLYHWLTNGKYRMLTWGVSLIALSHVLNFILLLITLAIFTMINYKKLNKDKMLNIAKAIGLTVLLTSMFWLPSLIFGMSTDISMPQIFPLGGISLVDYTGDALSNNVSYGFTIVAILGFVFGTISYKHLFSELRQVYWVSLAYVLLSSNLFSWGLLQNTVFKIIQFPWRILIFPQLGFCLIFCVTISYFLAHITDRQLIRLCVGGLCLVALALSIDAQRKIIKFEIGSPEINFTLSSNPDGGIRYKDGRAWYKATNNYEYANLMGYIYSQDYYPKRSTSEFMNMANHNMILHKTHAHVVNNTTSIPDGTETSLTLTKPTQKVTLPTMLYGSMYRVSVDNNTVNPEKDAHDLLVVRGLSKGKHTVRVAYRGGAIRTAIVCLTVAGLVVISWPEIVLAYSKRRAEVAKPITSSK